MSIEGDLAGEMADYGHGPRHHERVQYLRRWADLIDEGTLDWWLTCRYCGNHVAEEDVPNGIMFICYGVGACGQRYWLDAEDA
jgi:hypothetical protein